MKMLKATTLSAVLLLVAGTASGVHMWEDPGGWWGSHFVYEVSAPRYTAYELSFDAFGTYQAQEDNLSEIFETNIRHGIWGGGVGLNYFFTRYIGLGVDVNASDNRGNFIDQASASLLLRAPLGNSGWAPYIYGGGARGTDPEWEWLAHGGLGIEYRWNPVTGIFVDGRYVWADETFDRLSLRAGFRFVF
jgi:hypothetical protein